MATENNYSSYILPAGAVLLIYSIAQKFHLIPSQESQKADADAKQLSKFDAFSIRYVTDYIANLSAAPGSKFKITLLTTPKAEALASELKKAKGFFKDDNTAVYSVFRLLKSKSQLSQVAKVFNQMYKLELFAYLEDFMNAEELAKIYEITKDLPAGITRI